MAEGKILIKTPHQIMKIGFAGRLVAQFFYELGLMIRPGHTTMDLENYACGFCEHHKVTPTFKGVPGYKHA